ncbi:type IV pilus modification PilV family protein [Fontivita pretiosa]|uniref:type IV pilus modification PilV family protein n=1 Tax=Fontivita pretiosa TaxID=2989684 RepID=UPI003D16FE4B
MHRLWTNPGTPPSQRRRLRARTRGFTLMEAAMTTVIVGVGFMAMLQLLATGTANNLRGVETTTAINLAKNVREYALKLPFDELSSLNGTTYTPPIDSRGTAVSGFEDWSQQVTVQPVDPDRLTLAISDDTPDALQITVSVSHQGRPVASINWFAFDGTP